MFILTPDRKPVATEEELTAAFEEHCDHGYRCFQLLCLRRKILAFCEGRPSFGYSRSDR